MKILLTDNSRRYLFKIIDLETGRVYYQQSIIDQMTSEVKEMDLLPHVPTIRPYGITWNECELFIANNGRIITFDPNFGLKESRSFLPSKTHQIAYHKTLWATVTRKDCLYCEGKGFFFLDTNQWSSRCWRISEMADEEKIHINAINVTDARIYVSINDIATTKGYIYVYDHSMQRLEVLETGYYCHSISVEDDIYVLHSSRKEILGQKSKINVSKKGHSVRGMASTKDYFIIGRFPSAIWPPYREGDSEIVVVCKETKKVVNVLPLEGTGSINDLRVIDEYDYCHSNLIPFPCKAVKVF